MKSERRHELQHNMLADWLVENYQLVAPHASKIALALLVIVVAAVSFIWMGSISKQEVAAGWFDLHVALATQNEGVIETIAESGDFEGTVPKEYAVLISAEQRLASATDEIMRNKEAAEGDVKKAIEVFAQSLQSADNADVRQRTLFGLGRAHETMAAIAETESSLKSAKDYYTQLADAYADSAYAALAKERLADLERPSVVAFYEMCAEWEPSAAPVGGSLLPGGSVVPSNLGGADGGLLDLNLGGGTSGMAPMAPTFTLPTDDTTIPEVGDADSEPEAEVTLEQPTTVEQPETDEPQETPASPETPAEPEASDATETPAAP